MLIEKALMSSMFDKIWLTDWNSQESLNLSLTEVSILEMLASEGQKRAKELYEPLHITSGGITVICNWLIKKDFTERTPGDSYDRRFVVLEISDIGRKVVQEVFDMRLEVLSTHFGSLMDEEIKEWNQKYKKLLKQVVSR